MPQCAYPSQSPSIPPQCLVPPRGPQCPAVVLHGAARTRFPSWSNTYASTSRVHVAVHLRAHPEYAPCPDPDYAPCSPLDINRSEGARSQALNTIRRHDCCQIVSTEECRNINALTEDADVRTPLHLTRARLDPPLLNRSRPSLYYSPVQPQDEQPRHVGGHSYTSGSIRH